MSQLLHRFSSKKSSRPFPGIFACSLASLLVLTGCLPSGTALVTNTPESTGTLTPSPTFIIPSAAPTSTSTPGPTLTPTADISANIGTLLFQDTFDSSTCWSLSQDQAGAASVSDNQLVLVVSQPDTFRTAVSPAVLPEDFFIQVSVYAELCQPGDKYGIVFRYQSGLEHLRFMMNCSGTASVTSVQDGRGFLLVPEEDTFAALSGQRISNTLGILARDNVYTFYINQIEVFQVKETQLQGTGFGVIVRTDKNDLATVSFDNILLYSLREDLEPAGSETPSSTLQSP